MTTKWISRKSMVSELYEPDVREFLLASGAHGTDTIEYLFGAMSRTEIENHIFEMYQANGWNIPENMFAIITRIYAIANM